MLIVNTNSPGVVFRQDDAVTVTYHSNEYHRNNHRVKGRGFMTATPAGARQSCVLQVTCITTREPALQPIEQQENRYYVIATECSRNGRRAQLVQLLVVRYT